MKTHSLTSKNFFIFVISFLFIINAGNLWAQSIKDIFMDGLKALEETRYDDAIARFETVIKMKPDLGAAYNFLGLAYKGKGKDTIEVMSYFEKAIDFDPKYAMAYENLGKAYYGLGNYDKALKYCLKAVQYDPDLMTAHLALGWIYLLGTSEPRSAIKHFKIVVDKNKTSYACLGLGIAYFQDHQFPLVLEMITTLRKMGEEKYAQQLEDMVKQGRYIPPTVEGMSLQMPQKRKGVLVNDAGNVFSDSSTEDARKQTISDIKNMPVHLKGKLDSPSQTQTDMESIPASERIKALQRNSRSAPASSY